MVLCDTNILINVFNGRQDAIDQLEIIGLDQVVLSAVTVMELYQGMRNKQEMLKLKKRIKFFDVIPISEEVSNTATELVETYKLSHGLLIPDALIGATGSVYELPLFTYNVRDFVFIPDLKLYQPDA